MTRALLDVNVLVALLDPAHIAHERVHAWAADSMTDGWATCPITQNGLVRVLSQPAYPGSVTVREAVELLRANTNAPDHEFWPCDTSLTDRTIDAHHLLGHRQITDAYLLALAVHHGGRLVTLDAGTSRAAVPTADADHLEVL